MLTLPLRLVALGLGAGLAVGLLAASTSSSPAPPTTTVSFPHGAHGPLVTLTANVSQAGQDYRKVWLYLRDVDLAGGDPCVAVEELKLEKGETALLNFAHGSLLYVRMGSEVKLNGYPSGPTHP